MEKEAIEKQKKQKTWLKALLVIFAVILSYFAYFLVNNVWSKSGRVNYLALLDDFVLTPMNKIATADGRTNILVMGKSGKGYQAPDLTDTMIVISVSQTKPAISSISLSRDIWIPELRAKINSAYYWGNQKTRGGGLNLAKETVSKIMGIPIQYALVIDFSGFKDVIDVLGGIYVNVEKSFTDTQFPIAGKETDPCGDDLQFKCRYETIHFDKGVQFMDGETALKFVRSRMAKGDEGTDFAREARQQEVVMAIKEKVLSTQILLNPVKLWGLWQVATKNLEADVPLSASAILARRVVNVRGKVSSYVLPEKLLYNPPISARYDFQYVFIPKDGDWNKVQDFIQKSLPF